jgi:hypothetical protein
MAAWQQIKKAEWMCRGYYGPRPPAKGGSPGVGSGTDAPRNGSAARLIPSRPLPILPPNTHVTV